MTKRLSRLVAALTGAPQDWTADEVATRLRRFADGTAAHSEWDYFCSGITLSNPQLEAIRLEASALHGPTEPYTDEKLRDLIARAEFVKQRSGKKPE